MNPQLYTHTRELAPGKRATPEDAQLISRLATKAQELASEHGIVLTRKEALQRVRGNLAHVMAMAEGPGVKESEWLP